MEAAMRSDASGEEERAEQRGKILEQIMELSKWKDIFQVQGTSRKEDLTPDDAAGTEHEEPDAGAGRQQGACASPVLGAHCFFEASRVPSRNLVSAALGGDAISLHTASELKKALFGSPAACFPLAWKTSRFLFREPKSPLGYALITDKAGARDVQMVVQSYIIKHLLFTAHGHEDTIDVQCLTSVSARDQSRALAEALTDVLCKSASGGPPCVCLASPDDHIGAPVTVTGSAEYRSDKVTETLRVFEFAKREDLLCFVKKHLSCFQDFGSQGAILFLYSALLSHGVDRTPRDGDHHASPLLQLHQGNYECTQALVNLLLTGQASPSLVNRDAGLGSDHEQQQQQQRQQGPRSRSEIGFLRWSRQDPETTRQVGSTLKTPRLPVWLCSVNGRLGVLFCAKPSLLSHWRTEHRFSLYYCSGSASQLGTVKLTLNTHSHEWEQGRLPDGRTEPAVPSLERLIHTRWCGTSVDWNGTEPFY